MVPPPSGTSGTPPQVAKKTRRLERQLSRPMRPSREENKETISSRKMEIPISTQNCKHMQSFGLESETLVRVAIIDKIFNLTLNHCSMIQCPICKKSGLMVQDEFTKKLLDESPSHLIYLDIKGEISYGPEIKDEPIEVITIEDEDEEGKENMIKNDTASQWRKWERPLGWQRRPGG